MMDITTKAQMMSHFSFETGNETILSSCITGFSDVL